MSAICPLKVQKYSEKQHYQIFATCRKMPILRALQAVVKSCKKPSEIFDSRTGHQTVIIRTLSRLTECSGFCFIFDIVFLKKSLTCFYGRSGFLLIFIPRSTYITIINTYRYI